MDMDVEKTFHMTGGIGETSYARNSFLQKKQSDSVKHITIETIRDLYVSMAPKRLNIADLGCSSGPNTLSTIKDIIEAVETTNLKVLSQPGPEFHVFLNDLPSNDFNSVFKALPDFHKELKRDRHGGRSFVFVAGYPGSFYGRLFPDNSLHFVYSSYSLHWLSKIPPAIYNEQGKSMNKGCIYISGSSPLTVSKAYYSQFKEDFSIFLKTRSEELVTGGRMVLILLGRVGPDHVDRGNSFLWELLTKSLADLVSQGKIDKEKLDSYEVHFYAPSMDEIQREVKKDGSFALDQMEMFGLESGCGKESSYGKVVAMTVRAIQESMLSQHFGERILDTLFENYGRLIDEEMAKEEINSVSLVIVLRKL